MYQTISFRNNFFNEERQTTLLQKFSPFERFIPELLSVQEGIKPVFFTHLDYPSKNLPLLKSVCEKNNLSLCADNRLSQALNEGGRLTLKKSSQKKKSNPIYPFTYVYISKDLALAKRARDLWSSPGKNDEILISSLLGYPECCVSEWHKNRNGTHTDHVYHSFDKTKKFDFRLNALFVSRYLAGIPYKLIFHYPCRYDCPDSIRLAKTLFDRIQEQDPFFAENLEFFLKQPVMYFDDETGIRFRGISSQKSINYSDFIIYADEPARTGFANLLRDSSLIKLTNNSLETEKGGTLQRKNILFRFDYS